MGFFYVGNKVEALTVGGLSLETIEKNQCGICPLKLIQENLHPNMEPSGSKTPDVYMLGEAPGKKEDEEGRAFVGKAGQTLRFRIPDEWEDRLRFSNVVRTRPPKNRDPSPLEIACCRPSVVADIEKTKPKAIFGFGNVPLHWAIKQTGITKWRGRRVPVQIGKHACWFFPMLHPSYVMRSRRFIPDKPSQHGSDEEFVFALDLERAFAAVDEGLPDPVVTSRDSSLAGISIITGAEGWDDVDRIADALNAAANAPFTGVDYETPCLRPYTPGSDILSTAISWQGETVSWGVGHPEVKWTAKQRAKIDKLWGEWLHDAPTRKIAHHLGFEMEWSAHRWGKELCRGTRWGCSETQAYILDSRTGCLNLDFLCIQNFGFSIKAINNVDRKNLIHTPLPTVLQYNGLDAKFHAAQWAQQKPRIKELGLMSQYKELVSRVPTFVLTQLKGIPVDDDEVKVLRKKWRKIMHDTEDEIDATATAKKFKAKYGHDYNPSGSSRDGRRLFNEMLGCELERVDEDNIATVDNELGPLTLKWRKAQKVLSTYINPLRAKSKVVYNGKIHPALNHTRTRTTRSSSDSPNSQNFPKRTDATKEVRRPIKPGPGYKVVSFDYGQIQARNVAMESKDERLVRYFWERHDIHGDWLDRLFRECPDWEGGLKALNKLGEKEHKKRRGALRHRSKNEFVFPSFFGAQPKSIAAHMGVPQRVIEKLQEEFYGNEFPDLKAWHIALGKFYKKNGYITGLSGHRRYAPITPNQFINSPIQADEAIIVVDGMSRLSKQDDDKLQASMEIHDDLTFIWETKEVDKLAPIVIKTLLHVPFKWAHIVPITVEMSIGDNWADMEELDEKFSSDDEAWQ